ncbi:TKL protein kinase [Saprolegnia parasitica CBS 223.65]|uniref:TKL protein kinase n=1 Tax=Saprolegnia parasitica (strain CBS 223.65) TaxID=695850 RepID=A0A067C317_SAPPC|nr:TKL protein kinase [Saprolegnia parasitica CBS 223.65]KDO25159.1 TKL protein kinase [Saprolegnia parasitica CBS 223.65]|eukprot:XP_012204227.1 TKL protein kinase [Saprolegnia parasitica CBS 223.65]
MTTCPYASAGNAILTADSYCDDATCVLDSSCRIVARYAAATTSFTGLSALGNLLAYRATNLSVINATGAINVQDVVLPTTLTSLKIINFTSLDVVRLIKALPSSLQTFVISNASALSLPDTLVWPSSITTLMLKYLGLRQIPPHLPLALRSLSLYNNSISSLDGLPTTLTALEMGHNNVTSVVDYDWTNMTYLSFEANPLHTFAFVQLSPKLVTFDLRHLPSPVVNISLSSDSCDALDRLPRQAEPYDVDNEAGYAVSGNINADTAKCASIHGVLRRIWGATTIEHAVHVCVLPSSTPGTSAPPLRSTSSSTLTWTLSSLALALIGAYLAYVFWRKQQSSRARDPPKANQVFDANPPVWSPSKALPSPKPWLPSSAEPKPWLPSPAEPKPWLPSPDVVATHEIDLSELCDHRLEASDLNPIKPLASNAYGEVWLSHFGADVVVVQRIHDKSSESLAMFVEEILLRATIESPYIVQFIGVSWHQPRDMECVLEYMNRGNLQDYLARHSPTTYPWAAKLEAIVSIVRGLIYLHTLDPPIIHRDLRSRNVLLDSEKGTKINDFGSSRETSEQSMTNGVGSYQWAAPELLLGSLYNTAVDIYSFGVLLTEFSTHQVPYVRTLDASTGRVYTQDKVMQLVTKGELVPDFDWARSPIWLIEIAQLCLATEPEKRPTALALAGLLDKHQFEVIEA